MAKSAKKALLCSFLKEVIKNLLTTIFPTKKSFILCHGIAAILVSTYYSYLKVIKCFH